MVVGLAVLGSMTLAATVGSTIPMIFGRFSVSGSPVGSPQTIADMLEFAARHDIAPVTEHFEFDRINDAMQHLRDGKARYRIVLDR